MPLENDKVIGTNADNSKNNDYCIYCYKDGTFTQDVTMNEMIEISLRHMKELFKSDPALDEKAALDNMNSFFPQLKRWSK
jgi:hypothetical protein